MPFLDTPASTFDPYATDRMQKMDMLKGAQADYAAGMQAPLGFLDPEMQRFLESKTREDVRSANPKAGGSGWLADREGTEMLKLRMAMLDKNLSQQNQQRDYMAKLAGIQQPQQYVSGETGMLSAAGGSMMGGAAEGLGNAVGQGVGNFVDWLFKKPNQQQNGMNVGYSNPMGVQPNDIYGY